MFNYDKIKYTRVIPSLYKCIRYDEHFYDAMQTVLSHQVNDSWRTRYGLF